MFYVVLDAEMPLVHEDDRRSIHESTITAEDGSVVRTTVIKANANADPLGNHYHDGDEHFTLVDGEAILFTQDVWEGSHLVNQTLLVAPAAVQIPRGVAHTFTPVDGPFTLVASTSCSYEDLGTHTWKLVRV